MAQRAHLYRLLSTAQSMINKNNYSINVFHNTPVVECESIKGNTNRKTHLAKAMEYVDVDGQVLEFGVHTANTINRIALYFDTDTVWGFDSFEGLPEDWNMSKHDISPKGFFSVDALPVVNDNVKLVKGWFNETLPQWIKENPTPIKFLHLDADLYSSTKEVLTLLDSQIVPGTVIVFDEMYHWKYPHKYTYWEQGEYRALKEWITENNREFVSLVRSKYMQVTVRITK